MVARDSLTLTRRAFLPLFFIGVSILSLGYTVIRSTLSGILPKKQIFNNPRYVKNVKKYVNKNNQIVGRMSLGFYINPVSQIVHFVEASGRIRCVSKRMNPERLKPFLFNLTRRDEEMPRVNKSVAAYSFEQAALSHLKEESMKSICLLLLIGITQDLKFTKHLNGKYTPSFRLYDLLAGLAVRSDNEEYLVRMLSMIERTDNNLKTLFEERIHKWTNKDSRWYRKWHQGLRAKWKVPGNEEWVF